MQNNEYKTFEISSSVNHEQISLSGHSIKVSSSGISARISLSGDNIKVRSSGNFAHISLSGNIAKVVSSGKKCVICCAGTHCAVKAKKDSWITLAEWDYSGGEPKPICVKMEFVDGERIKEDTFYKLVNGEFTEVNVL